MYQIHAQKALLKVPKIGTIYFGIESDPHPLPPLWNFSENSSGLVQPSFHKCEIHSVRPGRIWLLKSLKNRRTGFGIFLQVEFYIIARVDDFKVIVYYCSCRLYRKAAKANRTTAPLNRPEDKKSGRSGRSARPTSSAANGGARRAPVPRRAVNRPKAVFN